MPNGYLCILNTSSLILIPFYIIFLELFADIYYLNIASNPIELSFLTILSYFSFYHSI